MLLELLENDIQSACEFLLAEANTCSQGSNALANPSVNIIASHGLDDVLSLRLWLCRLWLCRFFDDYRLNFIIFQLTTVTEQVCFRDIAAWR
jgi:hypothetical protein